jgi:hypothetical protein
MPVVIVCSNCGKNLKVQDAGLEHLAGLTTLTNVDAVRTKVAMAGAEKLKKALPKVFMTVGD